MDCDGQLSQLIFVGFVKAPAAGPFPPAGSGVFGKAAQGAPGRNVHSAKQPGHLGVRAVCSAGRTYGVHAV